MAKAEYSNSDIMMMQQDAIKRVMDMNRRAQQTVNRANEARNSKTAEPQETLSQPFHDEQEDMNNRECYRQRNTDNCRQQNTDNCKQQNTDNCKQQQYTNQRNYTNNRTQYNRQPNRGHPFFGMRGPSYERTQNQRQPLPLQKDPDPPQKANIFEGILDRIGLDSEVILLLLLVFMLANEGADISLLLALGYIIL